MRAITIEKVGYFHCPVLLDQLGPLDQIDKLDGQILKAAQRDGDLTNSLIVLPEAFNIGKYDSRSVPGPPVEQFLQSLRDVARKHRVIFVAGILDRRKNSAYLIDGEDFRLVCHKTGDDLTGIYDPWTANPDLCNPVSFTNVGVGTLICMDATNDDAFLAGRRQALLARLTAKEVIKIICVPGRFNADQLSFRLDLPNGFYVVADGLWKRDRGSFIADNRGQKQVESLKDDEVRTWRLPSF